MVLLKERRFDVFRNLKLNFIELLDLSIETLMFVTNEVNFWLSLKNLNYNLGNK